MVFYRGGLRANGLLPLVKNAHRNDDILQLRDVLLQALVLAEDSVDRGQIDPAWLINQGCLRG